MISPQVIKNVFIADISEIVKEPRCTHLTLKYIQLLLDRSSGTGTPASYESQMALNHHVDAGNGTLVLQKDNQCF